MINRRMFGLGVAASAVMIAIPAFAASVNVDRKGLAIQGYDPVAYFRQSKAAKGNKSHSAEYGGATYYFSSAANKQKFETSPARYVPQYGGFCAYAVSKGYTASIQPDKFTIVKGKLYLNYNGQVQDLWRKDKPGHIASGDKNWPSLK